MLKSFIMDFITTLIIILFCAYGTAIAYLYFHQRHLLYHPAPYMAEPETYGLKGVQAVRLLTEDHLHITVWYAPPKKGEPVVLYLHGNTGNLGDRTERLARFIHTGMGLLAVSYRGFGGSEGAPSEEGLYRDARAAIRYLLEHQNIAISDIISYGESLGSGIASKMAVEFPQMRALVLEAPYTSIADRAAELYPYAPVRWILKDNLSNTRYLPEVHIPVLIFHGYLDKVMPISHSRALLTLANEPKEARFYEQVGHTDFDFRDVAETTHQFTRKP